MVGVSLASTVVLVMVLSIPLAAGSSLDLSPSQLATWIGAIYGIPSVLSILMVARYRQPLPLTGTLFAIVFVASLGDHLSYGVLAGSFMVAGAIVVVLGLAGFTPRLARFIPTPVVSGLLAGAVLPFSIDIFNALGSDRLTVGATLLAYLISARFLGVKPLAILPALMVGVIVAALGGGLGDPPRRWLAPSFESTLPVFSIEGLLSVTPVVVVLMTLQANLPSTVYVRGQGFDPPTRVIDLVTGAGTLLGSLLGPVAVSMSLPMTSLIAGPEGGERAVRHRAVYLVSAVALLVAVISGAAAALVQLIPRPLLLALAGLALLNVLIGALRETASGPLVFGPIAAFVIALSDISLLGFGPFFWALVIGIAVTLLLERDGLRQLQQMRK